MKKYNIFSLSDKELKNVKSTLFTIMNTTPCIDIGIYSGRPPSCNKCKRNQFCDELVALYLIILVEEFVRKLERNNDLC